LPGSEPSPAPTPAPAAAIAASAINPATGALSAPVVFPIEPIREEAGTEGFGSGPNLGATDSSIETGYAVLACVAMGLR
jgi:hypothetical protein